MDEKLKELDALFDFFREIDKEKLIERKTYVTGALGERCGACLAHGADDGASF